MVVAEVMRRLVVVDCTSPTHTEEVVVVDLLQVEQQRWVILAERDSNCRYGVFDAERICHDVEGKFVTFRFEGMRLVWLCSCNGDVIWCGPWFRVLGSRISWNIRV